VLILLRVILRIILGLYVGIGEDILVYCVSVLLCVFFLPCTLCTISY